jgi:hypothetical protein
MYYQYFKEFNDKNEQVRKCPQGVTHIALFSVFVPVSFLFIRATD